MRFSSFAALGAALAGVTAAAKSPPMLLKERVNTPEQWIRRGPAPDDHMLDLRFGLRQRAISELESKLLDVSDPDSANYGQWLSQSEVKKYLEPEEKSTSAVKRWLEENGIQEQLHKRSHAGDWLAAHLTVAQARDLLGGAEFSIYEHRDTGEQLVRTTQYSVPRDVNE